MQINVLLGFFPSFQRKWSLYSSCFMLSGDLWICWSIWPSLTEDLRSPRALSYSGFEKIGSLVEKRWIPVLWREDFKRSTLTIQHQEFPQSNAVFTQGHRDTSTLGTDGATLCELSTRKKSYYWELDFAHDYFFPSLSFPTSMFPSKSWHKQVIPQNLSQLKIVWVLMQLR